MRNACRRSRNWFCLKMFNLLKMAIWLQAMLIVCYVISLVLQCIIQNFNGEILILSFFFFSFFLLLSYSEIAWEGWMAHKSLSMGEAYFNYSPLVSPVSLANEVSVSVQLLLEDVSLSQKTDWIRKAPWFRIVLNSHCPESSFWGIWLIGMYRWMNN